tara:strand:- start:771 stop:881 length:111 start_codon:yes stop_codon:yes gene_type:complete
MNQKEFNACIRKEMKNKRSKKESIKKCRKKFEERKK